MTDDSPFKHDRLRWTIVPRILASLCFAVLAGAVGLLQPFVWDWVATALEPGLFQGEYPLLIPLILAVPGVLGGGILGLVAGAAAPNRMGLALSMIGLALLHVAIGVLILIYRPTMVIVLYWFLAPSVLVELILAAALWLLPQKRRRP
ncbi:MAG: hypothetical protein J5I93_22605 [Pirellulaceae bacterium]|nr:hypothetical protein [Pirellulaceae bacterium]